MADVVNLRDRTKVAFETNEEQVQNVKTALSEAVVTKIVAITEDADGNLKLYNANNTPADTLWAGKLLERYAMQKAGYTDG